MFGSSRWCVIILLLVIIIHEQVVVKVSSQGSVLLDIDLIDKDNVPLMIIGDDMTSAVGLPTFYDRNDTCFDIRATSTQRLNFTGASVLFNVTEPIEVHDAGHYYDDDYSAPYYEDTMWLINGPSYYVSRGKIVPFARTLNNGTITTINLPQWTVTDRCGLSTDGKYIIHQASLCDNYCYTDVGPNSYEFVVQNGFGIYDFVLMDADANIPVENGFRCTPRACRSGTTSFAIDVVTYGTVGSVKIDLLAGDNGFEDSSRIENTKPFSSFGNKINDIYVGREFPAGTYTIKATAFTLPDSKGMRGPEITYTFAI